MLLKPVLSLSILVLATVDASNLASKRGHRKLVSSSSDKDDSASSEYVEMTSGSSKNVDEIEEDEAVHVARRRESLCDLRELAQDRLLVLIQALGNCTKLLDTIFGDLSDRWAP